MVSKNKSGGKSKPGRVFLVGAGPGDLGLVTLRARECIEMADVIVYDYLANPEMLAWAREDAEIIYVGKRAGEHTLAQEDINALLIEQARAGKKVVRLKGGDPFVFGRGAEEAKAIVNAGIEFEIVPGISSAIAGPAYAGIPVTHRDRNSHVTFFTGHEDPAKVESAIDFAALARLGGTQVMLMGVERIEAVAREMVEHGARKDLPVALVRWATTGRQETLTGTLANIAERVVEAGFQAPAVAVFGDVVTLRDDLNWHEHRPLSGKRIVVTRTRKQAGSLSRLLRDLGADVFELPTIRIEPPTDLREFAELVRDAHTYDWVVFTSPNGVDAFLIFFTNCMTMRARLAEPGLPRSVRRPPSGCGIFICTWICSRKNSWLRRLCRSSRSKAGLRTFESCWPGPRRRGTCFRGSFQLWELSWTRHLLIALFRKRAT